MQKSVQRKIDAFFEPYPERSFGKGQILIYAGDDPPGVFYLTGGQVRQYDINKKGDEVVVNVFKSPAFLPMTWAAAKIPNRYFYESFTPVTVRVAPTDKTMAFIKENSDVAMDLLSRVFSGVEGMQRRMAHLMGGSVRSRLLFELVVECTRFGEKQKDGSYILDMHETELASRSGLSRETVSRHLSKLDHGSFVKVTHKHILIKDLKGLEEDLLKTGL